MARVLLVVLLVFGLPTDLSAQSTEVPAGSVSATLEALAVITEAERIKAYATDCQEDRAHWQERYATMRAYSLKLEEYAKRLETKIAVQEKMLTVLQPLGGHQ